ncbi:hypothetical protein AVEN_70274-1 [Araneus ventricosus]|uniref:Uncharacterized protein n=1 Tax=Araneus ventricosus TaxID=182803 RepID=A0A4Y2RRR4_ARAVE|nr:hypothetical protein AVEN_70274-1 [Araneus ventricosus]
MLPVDGRQLENVKGELLKLKKKEAADCPTMAQRGQDRRAEETEEQRNNGLSGDASCVGRREEPKKQKNKEMTGAEKEELQGMLPVDGRQLENVKGEWLKLKKKEAADCQLWHNVARAEERKKQKNKEIADCQTWHNVSRREEPRKQKNKEIDDWQ